MVPNPLVVILTEAEAAAVLEFSSDVALHPLHTQIRDQLVDGNLKVSLPDPLLGRLVRVMIWGYGPTHTVMTRAFRRVLTEMLAPRHHA